MALTEPPNRVRSTELLDQPVLANERLATDPEVFQEVLHRYTAINRPAGLANAYATMTTLVDEVLPISIDQIDAAKALVLAGSERVTRSMSRPCDAIESLRP